MYACRDRRTRPGGDGDNVFGERDAAVSVAAALGKRVYVRAFACNRSPRGVFASGFIFICAGIARRTSSRRSPASTRRGRFRINRGAAVTACPPRSPRGVRDPEAGRTGVKRTTTGPKTNRAARAIKTRGGYRPASAPRDSWRRDDCLRAKCPRARVGRRRPPGPVSFGRESTDRTQGFDCTHVCVIMYTCTRTIRAERVRDEQRKQKKPNFRCRRLPARNSAKKRPESSCQVQSAFVVYREAVSVRTV